MKKNRILNLALLMGLLPALAFMAGCTPEETGGEASSIMPLIIMLALIIAMFYFLLIRPMRQREKTHDRMVEELETGDRVITTGGIYGEVERI
ncbi:preprotein translocase subunit YajC, partial [Chloroflexota bacterium]